MNIRKCIDSARDLLIRNYNDVKTNLHGDPQNVHAFVRCYVSFCACMVLITIPSVKKFYEPVEFIVIQMTIVLLPYQRLGPHLEFVLIALLGTLFGASFCMLTASISVNLTETGDDTRAALLCTAAALVVFFSMAISYSRPNLRIFSVAASMVSIIISGILFTQEETYNKILVNTLYAGFTPAIISMIVSLVVFPSFSSSRMRAELENGMNNTRKALELVVPLIVAFPEKGPSSGDIDQKLEKARKAVEDGKANLVAMNKCRIESRYEIYRWYYSLWSYAEIQERVQVALRHLSGLIISVEVLYKSKNQELSREDGKLIPEDHHQQHVGHSSQSDPLSHVNNLLWLMLEALESSMLLLLHPTSISNTPSKGSGLEECKIDTLLSNSIRACEDVRDDILQDLIGTVVKNSQYSSSEIAMRNNLSSGAQYESLKPAKSDMLSPGVYDSGESSLPGTYPGYCSRESNNSNNDTGLCVFFFYFSLRQSARACLETQRSARNLYAYHVHQKRHTFWPHFFFGSMTRSDLFPRKKRWDPKIWRKGLFTIPSDFVYFTRIVFSRGDIRFGLKCSLVMLLCYIWAYIKYTREYYYRFRGQWTVVSAVLTLSPTTGNTSSCVGHRMIGTIIGASWAIIVKIMPNTVFSSLIGLLPFALVCLYLLVFTKYASLSRIALFGYVLVGFNRPSTSISYDALWPEDSLTSTLILAGIRSLTVLLGTALALVASYIIFPTFSRIKLRLTMSRVLRSAASLLTERIAHHLREVRESSANCEILSSYDKPVDHCSKEKSTSRSMKDENRYDKNITWEEAHAISHSLYKGTKLERKTRINDSLLAIHAFIASAKIDIKFASEEPNIDRPFDKNIYSAIIERCASMVNLLSIIEGALESQVLEELDPSSLMIILWNSHYHGVASLTATMYILSHSLSTPLLQPLPACLPIGLARQDLNRVKMRLMRTIYANPEQFRPRDLSIKSKDNTVEDHVRHPGEAVGRAVGSFSSMENLPLMHDTHPTPRSHACTQVGPDATLDSRVRFSALLSGGNYRIPRTATTTERYRGTHLSAGRSPVDSVAVRQAADATLKLKSKNIPPYHTLFRRNYSKSAQRSQESVSPLDTAFHITKPDGRSLSFNSPVDTNMNMPPPPESPTKFSRSERNISPSISLVDIYIYAYYYAVECLINEVERLETEVEKLLGRELSFEMIPRKTSFTDLNIT